jgi:CO dehydrogenase maturation factor
MEAGVEHLSRSTTRASDVMLVIAEPYYKSLETAGRVKKMADELGIPHTYLVANKVRTPAEAEAIQAFCQKYDLELIATIPYDEKVNEASQIPRSPLDLYPDTQGVTAVVELANRLETMFLN